MPPSQDINNQPPTPQPTQPGVQPESSVMPPQVSQPFPGAPIPTSPAPGSPVNQNRTKKMILAVIALVLLVGLGTGAYAYQKAASTKKSFNDLALSIKNQEISGAKNYVAEQSVLNAIGSSLDQTSANTDSVKQKMDQEVASFQKDVDTSCANKSNDITSAKIDAKMSGLKLGASQKQYISDMKKVVSNLEGTDYSNTGVCLQGPAIVSLAKNIVNFLPGFDLLGSIGDLSNPPTASQMATLKAFTTMALENQSDLEKSLPNTMKFLTDVKSVLGDLYYELAALQANDTHTAATFDLQIQNLAPAIQNDSDALIVELNNLDKKTNDAAVAASKAEISAIDYQTSHKTSNSNMQLDYALPAFRIADASVSNYDDQHDKYPSGTSVNDIANLDDNMKLLTDKSLLKSLTYSSLGNDQSGFSLSTKLSDGTTLSERADPSSQNI